LVLSAGAINTPQLLQLSGIGPAALLEQHGIPVLADHPAVGSHLQDHLAVSYFFRSTVPTLNNELYPWHGKLRAIARYLATRSGPLSMSVNQGGGFVRSDPAQPRANLQLYFNPMTFSSSPGRHRRLLSPDPFPGFLLSCQSCRPTSRGQVKIGSANPLAAPLIYANSLSTEKDIAEVIAGTRLLREIAATRPLRDYTAEEFRPGIETQSDAERLADFRQRAGSIFHPVGTCRMGPDPRQAVVDARLRVHGIAGLRIIDASVFPTVTSGNTNAPTIMVAEKATAMLLEDDS
jgi:choline dehydrogenase